MQPLSRSGHNQLAMFDALDADKFVGNFFDVSGKASYHQNFKAIMRVQMHVQSGDNLVMVYVLMFCQLIRKIAHMMIVHQRHSANHLFLAFIPFNFDQRGADKIS